MGDNKGILVGAVLALLVFSLAPSLVWVIIGAQEIDSYCQKFEDSPTLSAWLVVEGSVGIFLTLLAIPLIFVHKVGHAGFIAIGQLFFLAWNIIGAYRLSQDYVCEQMNTRLYNTALAAVIYGFFFNFFSLLQAGAVVKADDGDDNRQ
jgi:hypothetical protein